MKTNAAFSVIFCGMCFLVFFQSPSVCQEKPLGAIPDPSNFTVGPQAFGDFSSVTLYGQLVVKSNSLRNWLRGTGSFGELVGLSDKRKIDPLISTFTDADTIIEEGTATPAEQELQDSLGAFPDDRVCDIVYQFLRKNYDFPAMKYRYGIEKRDDLIQKLILTIQRSQKEKQNKRTKQRSRGPMTKLTR